MLWRVLRFLIALAALPLAWGLTWTFINVLGRIPAPEGALVAPGVVVVFAGLVIQLLTWLVLPMPVRTYVLGHELTHALWGVLFGAKVSKLRVAAKGGSVTLSKSNVLITLAPYIFPFYTILVGLVALLTRCFVSPLPWPCVWLFLVGFTWSFHCFFTIRSLLQAQPDIEEYGHVFSYVFIWVFNVLGAAVWVICVAGISWKEFGGLLCTRVTSAYSFVWQGCVWVYESLRTLPVLQG
ncbi:MAG: hypothetical protein Q4G65_07430 [bacterium]|nr:hypothetical protein [bacterium]